MSCHRLLKECDAHKARQMARKEMASLPKAADQKLIDGRNAILLMRKILKVFLFSRNASLIDESKTITPNDPMMLKIMKTLRYENPNFFVNKLAKKVTKSVPNATLTSSKRDSS